MTGELIPRYTYVYIKGDYDERRLPGVNDIDTFDTLAEVKREREMVAAMNGLPNDHYVLVVSYATPWEVIGE